MSVRSPLLSGCRVSGRSQTHAVTQPRSARRCAAPLGPSAPPASPPLSQSAVGDRLACSEAEAVRTRLPGTLQRGARTSDMAATSAHLEAAAQDSGHHPADNFRRKSADLSPGS